MSERSPALQWLRIVAVRLGDLVDDVVFLGGATVELLITDPGAPHVRPTKDVDVIVEIGSWTEYAGLSRKLRDLGFQEDTEEEAPLCRWVIDGIKVDVMPGDPASQARLPELLARLERVAEQRSAAR